MNSKVYKAFANNKPNNKLSQEMMVFLMNIMFTKDTDMHVVIEKEDIEKKSEFYKKNKDIFDMFQTQVFLTRLYTLTPHKITFGMLIMLLDNFRNPAHCVMYIYYINSQLSNPTIIDADILSTVLFPWGFFTDEQLRTIWDAQKVTADDNVDDWHCHGAKDNLLDYNETWEK